MLRPDPAVPNDKAPHPQTVAAYLTAVTMDDREWAATITPEQLEWIIGDALTQRDMKAVDAALRLLAVKDPHRAAAVIETMRLGIALADATRAPSARTSGPECRDV